MQARHRSALLLFLAGLAAGACTEQTLPTAIPDGASAAVAAAAGPNSQKVKVKMMQLSSNTLRIEGPSVGGQVSIGNSGLAISSDVVVRADITQGDASRQALDAPVQCSSAPGEAGKLPTGTCTMTFSAAVSNAAPGSGPALAPGPATFTLRVIQTSVGGDTELASKDVLVTLVAKPSISALSIAPNILTIEGPAATYSATFQNPAGSLQGVAAQGWVVQGSTRRAAGGTLVTCSAPGVLPTGTCAMSSLASASNNGVFTPTFVAGEATFVLYLIQDTGGISTVLDSAIVPITLTRPIISLLTLASPTVEINGELGAYTVKIVNEGVALSDVLLQGELVQTQPGGLGTTVEVTVGAGGTLVTCGGPPGLLPSGTCEIEFGIAASTSAGGNGTIQPGPATFVLHLYKAPPNVAPYEWDRKTVEVDLTSPAPTLTSVVPTSTDVVLNSPLELVSRYVATINNPGVARRTVVLQAEIKQGTAVRGAGGSNVGCGGDIALGVLPNGTCTENRPFFASNSSGGGGTLVPGPATLEVSLLWFDGNTTVVLDTKSVAITLVAGPTITDLVLEATDILPGTSTTYTATITNPLGTVFSGIGIQGYLDQGSITSFGTGGTALTCSEQPIGVLVPGTCIVTFTLNTSNTGGIPPWQQGEATFRLQLTQGNLVLDERSVIVRLTGLQ
ncbi:MAG TPA: hypothetical protein VFZ21_11715 [Gemmatimonadaceae bacterium]|jgi:hypothetical protein|nr:hypothetical protein [Gemmatimonadaceae bacterium]